MNIMDSTTARNVELSTDNLPSGTPSINNAKERVNETANDAVRGPGSNDSSVIDPRRFSGLQPVETGDPPMTVHRFMSFVAMAFLWTSAQVPPYLFGGIPLLIVKDIGGASNWIWFISGNLLGSAAICPFVGAISDLLGRRYVAMLGALLVLVGQIVCSAANNMNVFIGGMVISGIGAGINELTALAGTAELAPTSKRGIYIAALILSVLPWCPSVLWAQLITAHSSWRFVGLLSALWAFVGLLIVGFSYFPPPRVNSRGLSISGIVARVDFLGGLLSIGGITLFNAGLLWGGYQYAWNSAHVLATIIIGTAMLIGFACWEIWGAKYPMFPRRLGKKPRTLVLLLVITFVAGANFFAVIMLWPSQAYNVYGHDPVGVGIRGLPFAFGVLGGCVINLLLLTRYRRGFRWFTLAASCIMTAGCGALAAATRDNIRAVYAFLFLAGMGVGGVVLPAAIVSTIICPDDLIATITSLTLAIRVVGGAVGYTVYYNVFYNKVVPLLIYYVGGTMVRVGGFDPRNPLVETVVEMTGASMIDEIGAIPAIASQPGLFEKLVVAGQIGYAEAYPWVYYCSIAFGGLAILCSLFLEDISEFMDDHVAVVIR